MSGLMVEFILFLDIRYNYFLKKGKNLLTNKKNYANIIKSLSWGREITAGRVRGREAGE
ncbi:MAG: hypothetical protein PWQ76_1094, partial [Clostridiales bacterium]|nr:hypothetical protein [Clostridiales bacterium]